MFKRLSKSRRHSADNVGGSRTVVVAEDPSEDVALTRKTFENRQEVSGSSYALLRTPRAKHARRSCGDSPLCPLSSKDVQPRAVRDVNVDTDYQMVTAVPAYIVEHEPEKRKGLGVWGRRMTKKIDSFRRAGSRELTSPPEKSDKFDNKKMEQNSDARSEIRIPTPQRSASPFKSFFIRMGSTGMLNSTKSNRRSRNTEQNFRSSEKENLFRSCSTSQLNTSPTYVKGDDPSEGIDLQINKKEKTVSCDNLAGQQEDDVFDITINMSPSPHSPTFNPCDINETKNDSMRKSASCDFKEVKKSNFPYAFLRSKLSVLPEERHSSLVLKDDRLFKTASEEHFPTLRVEESYDGTTTLGRRRARNNFNREFGRLQEGVRIGRNSYSDIGNDRSDTAARCEQDRYSLNPSHLERIEDNFQQEDLPYGSYVQTLVTVQNPAPQGPDANQDQVDFGCTSETRFVELPALNPDVDVIATLRVQRRNSAPSADQRLSSHYVSSNESGYDSDGPRGESAAASESEAVSLKCADSSDASSVIDSEIEKPMRSSTPSEYQQEQQESLSSRGASHSNHSEANRTSGSGESVENIDGSRWHRSSLGRVLRSIHHQTSFNEGPASIESSTGMESSSIGGPEPAVPFAACLPHRLRLQQDKTRFLSQIVQPPERVRRCRLIKLTKNDSKRSLGIRLAQQRVDGLRYVVVELENDGIAHRDGRLRLGDEIVEVEGKELRSLESLQEVQDFLASFKGNKVQLMTAYEETVPQVYTGPPVLPGENEYLENAKNLSNISLFEGQKAKSLQEKTSPTSEPIVKMRNRPDYPALPTSAKERKDSETSIESIPEAHQYLTKHTAKFEKGYGKLSLGFSVVGGRDSPRGEMGIFVRRVFPGGQADVSKSLFQGDEILTLNGKILRGYTHQEVIELFKAVREGPVELEIARRHRYPKIPLKAAAPR